MQLDRYQTGNYSPGAPFPVQLLWFFIGAPLVRSYCLPFSLLKVWVLRVFGARIGRDVRIKPGVIIKFPWRLEIGDHSWIGEKVWIDNLAQVRIGNHCCLSQGVYLCTGDHDWSQPTFDLNTAPIQLRDHVWLAAFSMVAPGVVAEEGAVLSMGSLATGTLAPWSVYRGSPATKIKERER